MSDTLSTEPLAVAEPLFTGTPDDWWERAEEITEAEAADRALGDWYIGREAGSYRVSTSNPGTNESRKNNLRRDIERGKVSADAISPKVRRLIHVEVTHPAWVTAELLVADREVGSLQRETWRRNRAGRWQLLSDARISISSATMAELNPRIAVVHELTD